MRHVKQIWTQTAAWNPTQLIPAKINQAPEDLQCMNKKQMLGDVLLRFQGVWYPVIADRYTIPPSSAFWEPTQEEAFWEKEPSREILSQESIPYVREPCSGCNTHCDSPLPESINVLVIIVVILHLGVYKQEVTAVYNYPRRCIGWDYHVHFAKRK